MPQAIHLIMRNNPRISIETSKLVLKVTTSKIRCRVRAPKPFPLRPRRDVVRNIRQALIIMRSSRVADLSIRVSVDFEERLMQASRVTSKRDIVRIAISNVDAYARIKSA
jgi:hypothetical protein